MKTMKDYILYCTVNQTVRAYKLGAPLKVSNYKWMSGYDEVEVGWDKDAMYPIYAEIPTTQQMIGWLREKGLSCQVYSKYGKFCAEVIDITEEEKELRCINEDEIVGTYEQAELDAIDAALDYLEKGE